MSALNPIDFSLHRICYMLVYRDERECIESKHPIAFASSFDAVYANLLRSNSGLDG